MRVTVRLFARLRDLAGPSELDADVAPGATIADVWAGVVGRHPALAPFAGSLSAARNLEYARLRRRRWATATRSRSCRRSPAAEPRSDGPGLEP